MQLCAPARSRVNLTAPPSRSPARDDKTEGAHTRARRCSAAQVASPAATNYGALGVLNSNGLARKGERIIDAIYEDGDAGFGTSIVRDSN